MVDRGFKPVGRISLVVDGWDFKQYILGTLFYRFISENFASYIEGGDESIHYSDLTDEVIIDDILLIPRLSANSYL
jgi:type I restriction-modification system DNA methylase subunit